MARRIELLAPAKDLACGREAILHGADAVYIGAPKFGARAAAGNSLDDIRALCDFAHIYNVSIYVALNTILRDDELKEAERMIHQLYDAGVDALIVQDLGLTRLDLPPIALHAGEGRLSGSSGLRAGGAGTRTDAPGDPSHSRRHAEGCIA